MKKAIIAGALSIAVGQASAETEGVVSVARSSTEDNKARVAEICKSPEARAHMIDPDSICDISEDGGKTWIPVGAAALATIILGGGAYVIRRRKRDVENVNKPTSIDFSPKIQLWQEGEGVQKASKEELTNHKGVNVELLKFIIGSGRAHEYIEDQWQITILIPIAEKIQEQTDILRQKIKSLANEQDSWIHEITDNFFQKAAILIEEFEKNDIPVSFSEHFYEMKNASDTLEDLGKRVQIMINTFATETKFENISDSTYQEVQKLNQDILTFCDEFDELCKKI